MYGLLVLVGVISLQQGPLDRIFGSFRFRSRAERALTQIKRPLAHAREVVLSGLRTDMGIWGAEAPPPESPLTHTSLRVRIYAKASEFT